jgi:hypothetical protein
MRQLYADFNDFDATGNLPLICAGSRASITALDKPLRDGEKVFLSDGKLRAMARVFMCPDGTWEARGGWVFER